MKQFDGTGSVSQDGREIARVHYMLTKSVDTFSVLPRTRGFVRILYGNIDVGRIYQLCLEDGAEVSFFARYTNGLDQPHATYSVTVSGDPEG